MTVKIRLLGQFEAEIEGQITPIRGQKTQALLAWLTAHAGQEIARDKLAGMFWGDAGASNARTSLRQALASLRRVLGDSVLVADNRNVRLDATQIDSDLQALRQAIDAEQPDVDSVMAIYRGDLLESLNPRSQVFEDWLSLEREQVRQATIAALERGLERVEADVGLTIEIATALAALDPLNEATHRTLMRAYAANGQASAALRQFDRCEEVLQRELNSPPSIETVQLLQAIKQGDVATAPQKAKPAQDSRTPTTDRKAALPSIAVLPFVSMSADPEHGYLADGMTEELINLLAQSVNWRVTARNSSFRYKDQHVDVREAGKELGVAYIVEGSIRRVGSRIRVTAQLVSTDDGTHIWSDRYDRPLDEIFDVQDEVVHGIFRVLKNRIGFAERERVRKTQTANLDAWGLLIKANQMQISNHETRDIQRALIREALAIDPEYPRGHAYLASVLFTSVGRGYSSDPRGDYRQAQQHADAALAAGAADVVVLKVCAGGYAAVGKSKDALQLAERAYELSGNPDPLLVAVLMWSGRVDEAYDICTTIVQGMAQGVPAPPGELRPIALLGNLEMLRGNLDEALRLADVDLRANPGNYFSHANLANVLARLNRMDEAALAWNKAVELMPSLTIPFFRVGYASVFTDEALNDEFCSGLTQLASYLEPK